MAVRLSSRLSRFFVKLCFLASLAIFFNSDCLKPIFSQEESSESENEKLLSRYLSVLEKNPQRGTTFDKVVGFFPNTEQLNLLIERYSKSTGNGQPDFSAWMIVGLLEQYRQNEPVAIAAFSKASSLNDESPLPWVSLGECYRDIGNAQQAVEAFEKALDRKLNRSSLVDICEQTGRLYLRMNQPKRALSLWKKIEDQFPDDIRTLERIARTLQQENQLAESIERFEKLATLTKDDFQRTQYTVESAQMRIDLGEKERGLSELESTLANLKPDGWLYADVQTKIEEVFVNASDQDGLVQYYEKRLEKHPDDIETMVRLARFLDNSARTSEAHRWIEKAIQLAPAKSEFRKQYVQMLVAEKKTAEAEKQYEKLATLTPDDTEVYRDWGNLILRDESRTPENAKKDAATVWKRMVAVRPNDSILHASVAMLLRSSGLNEEARSLYERAVELSPDKLEFREYLGEFLHSQGNRLEAIGVWEESANRHARNADSLASLADAYERAKELEIACERIGEACTKNSKDSGLWLRAASIQSKARHIDEALNSLDQAEQNANSNEQRERILSERIDLLANNKRLEKEIDTLRSQLNGEKSKKPLEWFKLGRYLIRLEKWAEADVALNGALLLDEHYIAALDAKSSIALNKKEHQRYIELLRKLSKLDRRKEADYIKRIANHQILMGNKKGAIETAIELLNVASSKVDANDFLASICFQAGNHELGVQALQRALALEPSSSSLMMSLATALVSKKDFDAAEKLYWKAFSKSRDLNTKLDLTVRLVDLYKQTKTVPKLVETFQQRRKNNADFRDMTVCLAQIYQSAGDVGGAKSALEELITDRTQDTRLLKQYVDLCVAGNDYAKAVTAQRRLTSLVQDDASSARLATLLKDNGDFAEAYQLRTRLLQKSGDTTEVLREVDSMIAIEQWELIQTVLEPRIKKEPDQWEFLFRMAIAKARTNQWKKACELWERILQVDARYSDIAFNPSSKTGIDAPLTESRAKVGLAQIQNDATSLEFGGTSDFSAIARGQNTLPTNYGETRFASLVWLSYLEIASPQNRSRYLGRLSQVACDDRSSPRSLSKEEWLSLFVASLYQQNSADQITSLAALASLGDATARECLLHKVKAKRFFGNTVDEFSLTPLPPWQLDALVESFVTSSPNFALHDQPLSEMQLLAPIEPTGLVSNIVQPISIGFQFLRRKNEPVRLNGFASMLGQELRLAGKSGLADELLEKKSQQTTSVAELYSICEWYIDQGNPSKVEFPMTKAIDLLGQSFQRKTDKSQVDQNNPQIINAFGPNPAPTLASPRNDGVTTSRREFSFVQSMVEEWWDLSPASFEDKRQKLSQVLHVENIAFLSGKSLENRFAALSLDSAHELASAIDSPIVNRLLKRLKKDLADPKMWPEFFQQRIDSAEGAAKAVEVIRARVALADTNSVSNDVLLIQSLETLGSVDGLAVWSAKYLRLIGQIVRSLGVLDRASKAGHLTEHERRLVQRVFEAKQNGATRIDEMLADLRLAAQQNVLSEDLLHEIRSAFRHEGKQEELALISRIVSSQQIVWRQVQNQRTYSAQQSQSTLRQTPQPAQAFQGVQAQQFATQGQQLALQHNAIHQQLLLQQAMYRQALQQQLPVPKIPVVRTKPNTAPSTSPSIRTVPYSTPSSGIVGSGGFRSLPRGNRITDIATAKKTLYTNPSSLTRALAVGFYTLEHHASNPTLHSGSEDFIRIDAIKFLEQKGQLDKLINDCEKQSKNEPGSFEAIELLTDLYLVKSNLEALEKCLRKLIQLHPRSTAARLKLTGLLTYQLREEDARRELLELMSIDPASTLMAISLSSALLGADTDWLNTMKDIPWIKFADDSTVLDSSVDLLHLDGGFNIGATVLKAIAQVSPAHTRDVYRRAYASKPKMGRVFDFEHAILPTAEQAKINPWFGLNFAAPLHANETILFENAIGSMSQTEMLEVRNRISQHAIQHPDWLAGKMMLAIMAEQIDHSQALFASLLEDIAKLGCPDAVALRLGKVDWRNAEHRRQVVNLMQRFTGKFHPLFSNEDNPHSILASLLFADDQRVRAVTVLQESIRLDTALGKEAAISLYTSPNLVWNNGQPVNAYSRNAEFELAKRLMAIKLPVDAYRIISQVETIVDVRGVELPSKFQRKELEDSAVKLLKSLNPDTAIREIVLDRSRPSELNGTTVSREGPSAMELMLQIPSVSYVGPTDPTVSHSQSALIELAKKGFADEILDRLNTLLEQHPKDPCVLATHARLLIALGRDEATGSLHSMNSLLSKRHTDNGQIPGFSRSDLIALWLLASECYTTRKHLETADRIAHLALLGIAHHDSNVDSSVRTMNLNRIRSLPRSGNQEKDASHSNDTSYLLLLEWGGKIADSDNPKRASEIFERTAATLEPALQKTSHTSNLSRAQFNKILRVAYLAGKQGNIPFAKKCILSLTTSPKDPSNSRSSSIDAREIETVVSRWQSLHAKDKYDVLLSLVLPTSSDVISEHINDSSLLADAPASIAASLVDAASEAGLLQELLQKLKYVSIDEPQNGDLIKTLVALARKDLPTARVLLKQWQEVCNASERLEVSKRACHAAIRALEIEELHEYALPIIERYLRLELAAGSYPVDDFKLFPLPRRVEECREKAAQKNKPSP